MKTSELVALLMAELIVGNDKEVEFSMTVVHPVNHTAPRTVLHSSRTLRVRPSERCLEIIAK